MESGLNCLLKSIAFCDTASADNTMSFALHLAFLNMIHDLWPGNFSLKRKGQFSSPNFQCPNVSYPMVLMHEPQYLSALCCSLIARGVAPSVRKSPFLLGPRQAYPIGHYGKGSFLFHLALHIFKTLVATMALYKLRDILSMSA